MTETSTAAPAARVTATLTIEHSSHPDYLFVSAARMTVGTVTHPQRVMHHADDASVIAHVARLTAAAETGGIDFTIDDRR